MPAVIQCKIGLPQQLREQVIERRLHIVVVAHSREVADDSLVHAAGSLLRHEVVEPWVRRWWRWCDGDRIDRIDRIDISID